MTDTTPPEYPATQPATQPARDTEAESRSPALAIGAILVIVGLLLFGGQLLDFGADELSWPLWIVGAGVAILLVGLLIANERGLVVAGTIVTTVGAVLLYQNTTDHWESWAYAWALVGPAASGLGLMIWGARNGRGGEMRAGTWTLLGGLAMFVIGYLFFEGILGLSGERLPLPEWVLPAAVIVIGAVMLVRGLVERREPDAS